MRFALSTVCFLIVCNNSNQSRFQSRFSSTKDKMMAFGSCQRCQTVCSGFAIYKGKPAAIQRQPISCDAVAHQCSLFIIEFIAVP